MMALKKSSLIVWFTTVLTLTTLSAAEQVEIVTPADMTPSHTDAPAMDSYLQALKDSQGSSNKQPTLPPAPPTAASRYDPPGPPSEPPTSYIPSKPSYQSEPPTGYLPSKPSYHQIYQPYGPPSSVAPAPPAQPFYGIPFASPASAVMNALSGLIPKGIDLETVFKIILKLTLFKILVKFFAVICLLLAYPLFQSKDKDEGMMEEGEEEDDRQRQLETLNNLTAFVWDAIDPGNYTESPQLIERIVNDIDANMTQPSESAAIGVLEFCVNLANMTVNWMTSTLRRRNGTEVDPLQQFIAMLWTKLTNYFFNNQVSYL